MVDEFSRSHVQEIQIYSVACKIRQGRDHILRCTACILASTILAWVTVTNLDFNAFRTLYYLSNVEDWDVFVIRKERNKILFETFKFHNKKLDVDPQRDDDASPMSTYR